MQVLQAAVTELYETQKEVSTRDVVEKITEVAEALELPPVDSIFRSNTNGWGVWFKGLQEPIWLAAA